MMQVFQVGGQAAELDRARHAAGAEAGALEPYQQDGFLVHEQFSHLNWLSRALGAAGAPQNDTCYWESNSPGNGKEAGCVLGDVLAAVSTVRL